MDRTSAFPFFRCHTVAMFQRLVPAYATSVATCRSTHSHIDVLVFVDLYHWRFLHSGTDSMGSQLRTGSNGDPLC